MATNSLYVTTKTLEPYFVDKTTGVSLAGGKVYFYKDEARTTAKGVFQLAGAPPNYTFAALPNPITLSAQGTIMNAGGNNVALYYLPFETDQPGAAEELYYVVVEDSAGNVQFTREGWPSAGGAISSTTVSDGTMTNQISNSQFIEVLFDPSETLTIAYVGAATTTVEIAPNWSLEIIHNGNGSSTIVRTAIAGDTNTPTNPPYTLTITPGANITSTRLFQTLSGNPDIWVPSVAGEKGYVAGGALLGAGSTVTMNYNPSVGTTQQIFTDTNITAATAYFGDTAQLLQGDNTGLGGVGSVTIELVLSVAAATVISSVQVVGLESNETGVAYRQDTINRQQDYLSHFYKPALAAKPIPSYLQGWDFPLNPAQFLTSTVAAQAVGAEKSYYVWDQTILFQTADSGITSSRGANGSLKTLSAQAAGTQLALVQYLGQLEARKLLNSKKCVNVAANASVATVATISLWYTTDAQLPDIAAGTSNSIVLTLDASGKPATQNGAWTELARSNLGDAKFTIGTSATTLFNDYPFAAWDLLGVAATDTATYFAIVVGTAALAQNTYVEWFSISLQDGTMPTRPAPQSKTTVIEDCQQYYRMSFLPGVLPADNVGNEGASASIQTNTAGIAGSFGPVVRFDNPMRATPLVALYNPTAGAAAQIRTLTRDWTLSTGSGADALGFEPAGTTPAGSTLGEGCKVHWTCDARFGIVL